MAPIIMERKKCKKCNKGRLYTRVQRGLIVRSLLFWLPIKRYRCDSCNRTSYIYGSVLMPAEKPDPQV